MNIRRIRLLPVALLLALSTSASAYVLDTDGRGHTLHWGSSTVGYRLVSGNVPGGSAGEAAVHNAFGAWSSVSGINYRFDGFVSSGKQAMDNRNTVYWVYGGWQHDPTLLAITFRFFDTSNGRLLDADIVFNGQRYSWSVGGSGYDVENSATHEVGHFSGLGHSTVSDATMFASARAGETKKRTLSSDDIAGISALYGGTGAAGGGVVSGPAKGVDGGGGGGGGCAIGSTRSMANATDLLWLAALLGGILLRRRRNGATPSRLDPAVAST